LSIAAAGTGRGNHRTSSSNFPTRFVRFGRFGRFGIFAALTTTGRGRTATVRTTEAAGRVTSATIRAQTTIRTTRAARGVIAALTTTGRGRTATVRTT